MIWDCHHARNRHAAAAGKPVKIALAVVLLSIVGMVAWAVLATVLRTLNDKASGVPQDEADILPWDSPGPVARNAIPALVKCLSDGDEMVREAATNALLKTDPVAALEAGEKPIRWAGDPRLDAPNHA